MTNKNEPQCTLREAAPTNSEVCDPAEDLTAQKFVLTKTVMVGEEAVIKEFAEAHRIDIEWIKDHAVRSLLLRMHVSFNQKEKALMALYDAVTAASNLDLGSSIDDQEAAANAVWAARDAAEKELRDIERVKPRDGMSDDSCGK